jgi:hypothetical protein
VVAFTGVAAGFWHIFWIAGVKEMPAAHVERLPDG